MFYASSATRLPLAFLFAGLFAISLSPTSAEPLQRHALERSMIAEASTKASSACPQMPGKYVTLPDQPYALCAGAQAFNYNEITYAKCQAMNGTSISLDQSFPVPKPSGDITTINQGEPAAGGYVVSTYSPPAGATSPLGNLAIYNCYKGGTYAQRDGGICFTSTTGKSSPLWGDVGSSQIICSCPVVTTSVPFAVMGPKPCPADQATYDAVCGKNVSKVENGAMIYIGATPRAFETLAGCLGNTSSFSACTRPLAKK